MNDKDDSMANCVLIDVMNQNNFDAGTKARNDTTVILNGMGFETQVLFNRTHNSIMRSAELIRCMWKLNKIVTDDSVILVQYPYKPFVMKLLKSIIKRMKRRVRLHFVILVHDVLFLRNEQSDSQYVEKYKAIETEIFNSADYVIVHNQRMEKELLKAGVKSNMVTLGIFDYIYSGDLAKMANFEKNVIIFAGNLSPEKSGFLYKMEPLHDAVFNLYGSNYVKENTQHVYKGSFPPDELIAALEGNYGLVWDGDSANACTGNFGEYLKYNNPHKLSLYLAAGLPVIVWRESALASFVEKNGLGLTISKLEEINDIPKSNSEEYKTFKKNVDKIRNMICSGEMLRTAISKIEETYA